MIPFPKEWLEQEDRLLVLLEQEDGFHHVALNDAQFKAVSDAILAAPPKPLEGDYEECVVIMSEEAIPKSVFDGLESITP